MILTEKPLSNGRTYGTRNTTGVRKRKNYADLNDNEEEEGEGDEGAGLGAESGSDSSSSDSSSSGSDSSSSSGSDSDSSDSETEQEQTTPPSKSRNSRAKAMSSSKRPNNSSGSSSRSLPQKRTSQREPKRRALNGDYDHYEDTGGGGGRNARRSARNLGRQTVKYREEEESDFEYNENSDGSDTSSASLRNSAPVGVSSRGRIRKLTPRARASLLGQWVLLDRSRASASNWCDDSAGLWTVCLMENVICEISQWTGTVLNERRLLFDKPNVLNIGRDIPKSSMGL